MGWTPRVVSGGGAARQRAAPLSERASKRARESGRADVGLRPAARGARSVARGPRVLQRARRASSGQQVKVEAEVSVLVSLVILYTPLLGMIGAGGGAGGRIAAADASWMSTHLFVRVRGGGE